MFGRYLDDSSASKLEDLYCLRRRCGVAAQAGASQGICSLRGRGYRRRARRRDGTYALIHGTRGRVRASPCQGDGDPGRADDPIGGSGQRAAGVNGRTVVGAANALVSPRSQYARANVGRPDYLADIMSWWRTIDVYGRQ